MPGDLPSQVAVDGFAIVRGVLNRDAIDRFLGELARPSSGSSLHTRGGVFAIRNLLEVVPAASALARFASVRALVDPILGPFAIPVRAILFDKTPAANWLVPWHQDLTIAVCRRSDVAGYGPWSVKSGVPHVQPPAQVLDAMLAVRIHLDPCNETNGALRVLPGTHRCGRLAPDAIAGFAASTPPVTLAVDAGDAVLMRPLLVHASSAAGRPAHRRVVHIEFAAHLLPEPLAWRST